MTHPTTDGIVVAADQVMGVDKSEIQYVRDQFRKKYADNFEKLYDERDVNRLETNDIYTHSFIRGSSRLDEAVNLVHESLRFRKEYLMNDVSADSFDNRMWERRAVFYHNHSLKGRKILFIRVKQHKKESEHVHAAKRFFAFWLELVHRADPLEHIILLFDMSDAGLSNLDMDFVRFIMTCFKLYYPRMLDKMLVFEMPWLFSAAWKVIKTWLSAEALTKTKFVTKSDIQAYIGKDELLEHMGGSAALSSVIFQPTSPICDYRTPADSTADIKSSSGSTPDCVCPSPICSSANTFSPVDSNNSAGGGCCRCSSNECQAMPVNSGQESKSSARQGAFYYGRQLNICPADELVFVVDNSGKDVFDVIVITNTLVHTVAFKVKTTAPERYRVRPSTGIIRSSETAKVHVYLQSGCADSVELDKFLVMAVEVEGDTYDSTVWQVARKDSIVEHRMCCAMLKDTDTSQHSGMLRSEASLRVTSGSHRPLSTHHTKQQTGLSLEEKVDALIGNLQRLQHQSTVTIVLICVVILLLLLTAMLLSRGCSGSEATSSSIFSFDCVSCGRHC